MRVVSNRIPVLGLMGIALAATPMAASAKNTMAINAEVQQNCNLFVTPMMFGTVSIIFPQANAQSTLTIDCTPFTAYSIAMDDGLNYNGQRRMARMAGGNLYLNYEIYRDAARTQRWGQTGGALVSGVAPANGKVTLQAYGRTTGFLAIGAYEDTVTVTISF